MSPGRNLGPPATGLQGFYFENFDFDILSSLPDRPIPIRSDYYRLNKAFWKARSQTSLKNAFNLIFTRTDSQERLLPVSDHYPTSIRRNTNPDHPSFPCLFTRANNFDDLIL